MQFAETGILSTISNETNSQHQQQRYTYIEHILYTSRSVLRGGERKEERKHKKQHTHTHNNTLGLDFCSQPSLLAISSSIIMLWCLELLYCPGRYSGLLVAS